MKRALTIALMLVLTGCDRAAEPTAPAPAVANPLPTSAPSPLRLQAEPYLRWMRLALLKPTGQNDALALAETEHELGDARWFWTDDNAKALELYALPELRAHDPQTFAALRDFVEAMSAGDRIFRRAALPQLTVHRADPQDLDLSAGFLNLKGALKADRLTLSMRYHDGRTQDAAVLGGHRAVFEIGGERHEIALAALAESAQVIVRADELKLVTRATLNHANGQRLARLWVRYRIGLGDAALSRQIEVRVLDPRGASAASVEWSYPELLALRTRYREICADGRCEAPQAGEVAVARHYRLSDPASMSLSYTLDGELEQPASATIVPVEDSVDALRLRVDLGALAFGEKRSVRERITLRNGYLADAAPPPTVAPGVDPSLSYDYGAELNALACVAWKSPDANERERLRALFDRHYARFRSAALKSPAAGLRASVMTRGLAFTVLGLDCMARAWPQARYAEEFALMLNLLLKLQYLPDDPRVGAFDGGAVTGVYMDVHAAALLALARASVRAPPQPALAQAIERAVAALRRDAQGLYLISDGNGGQARIEWSYSAGLLARATRVLALAEQAGHLHIDDAQRAILDGAQRDALELLERAQVGRAHGTEILTRPFAGESNSETQAWGLLGLLDFDVALLQR
jgi:hypothetical protein